ncbi:MAG TPA: class I SAM-dependent methyltransferase [Usitatibacter sp.]|nr:class I SAM-dependent methyltransferase [Usitatibacter sp.]
MLEQKDPASPTRHAPIPALRQYFSDERARRAFLDRLFDGTARDYDFVERLLAFGSGSWYRRQALQRSGLASGMRVLDIATGTGLVAREAIATVGPTGLVLGLDPSAGMLEEARQLPMPLVRALGEKLPFPEASFDFVSMGFALRHVADLDALFSEMRRVLKPGGTACVLEITYPKRPVAAVPMRLFMTQVVPMAAWGRRRRDAARSLMRFYWDTIEACVPPAEVLASLSRAGLSNPARTLILGMFSEYVARKT